MKLKHLVGICLLAFLSSSFTILVIGMWVAPNAPNRQVVPAQSTDSNIIDTKPVTPATGTAASLSGQAGTATESGSSATPSSQAPQTTTKSQTSSPTVPPTGSSSGGGTTTPPPTPPPPTTPPPAPSCGSAGGACTVTQVATHSTQSNCWITYNSGYYIVTSYVNQHPGGKAVFNASTCGHDITAYLKGTQATAGKQYSHKNAAYSVLNSYYVGPVQ